MCLQFSEDSDSDSILKAISIAAITVIVCSLQVVGCVRESEKQSTDIQIKAIESGLIQGKIEDKPGVYWVKPKE